MLFPGLHPPARIAAKWMRAITARIPPNEIQALLEVSGFEVTLLETGPFREEPTPELGWVEHLLDRYMLPTGASRRRDLRGGPQNRAGERTLPGWLYS